MKMLAGVPTPEIGDAFMFDGDETVWEIGYVSPDVGRIMLFERDGGILPRTRNIGWGQLGPWRQCGVCSVSACADEAHR